MHTITCDAGIVAVDLFSAKSRPDLFDGEHLGQDGPTHALVLEAVRNDDELVVLGDHRTIAALVRRLVVRVRTALAGSGAPVLPDVPLRLGVIAAELQRAGLGLDDTAAVMLADQVDEALHRAGLHVTEREHEQSAATSLVLGPTADARHQLQPGAVIRRYTEPCRGGLWADMPCCDRWAKLVVGRDEYGDLEEIDQLVTCQPCSWAYKVVLEREYDGGYRAIFTVLDGPLAASRMRPPRRR
ncbi:hypothetical protein ACFQGX_50315 [Nonomuraea dietziae]